MNIVLDYKKDKELFNATAKKIADEVGKGIKATQMRKFYDYVLDLNEKVGTREFCEILPFVKMLNSKAAYAKNRKVAGDEFVKMIELCVNQVKDENSLNTFKLFFEAVLGFSKDNDKKDEK